MEFCIHIEKLKTLGTGHWTHTLAIEFAASTELRNLIAGAMGTVVEMAV